MPLLIIAKSPPDKFSPPEYNFPDGSYLRFERSDKGYYISRELPEIGTEAYEFLNFHSSKFQVVEKEPDTANYEILRLPRLTFAGIISHIDNEAYLRALRERAAQTGFGNLAAIDSQIITVRQRKAAGSVIAGPADEPADEPDKPVKSAKKAGKKSAKKKE